MLRTAACLLAALAIAPSVWGFASIHEGIDDAFEAVGLNPVSKKPNSK